MNADVTSISPQGTDDTVVTKCVSLFDLWRSNFTLSEFKILELYLSKINYRDPGTSFVSFTKAEFEQAVGMKTNSKDLKVRLAHFLKSQVMLPIPSKEGGEFFELVNLFDRATYNEGKKGEKIIELDSSRSAKRFFFNYEEYGYLRYSLNSILRLRSKHSFLMFMYLEKNRMIHNEWEESLDNLKEILFCSEINYLSEYRIFNDKVLKVAYNEITTKTSCWYSYAPGKRVGNKIVSIKFVLADLEEAKACGKAPAVLSGMIGNNTVKQIAEEATIISEFSDGKGFLEESDKGFAIPDYMDPIKGFEDLTKNNNALEVEGLLKMLPLKKLGWADEDLSREENYRKYLTVKAREIEGRGTNVRKKTRYLIRVIKNEIKDLGLKENKEVSKTSAEKYLSRYSQREYSKEEMDEIERRMLEKSLGLSIPQEGNKDLKE